MRDTIAIFGLAAMAAGLYMIDLRIALVVCGTILFAMAVWGHYHGT